MCHLCCRSTLTSCNYQARLLNVCTYKKLPQHSQCSHVDMINKIKHLSTSTFVKWLHSVMRTRHFEKAE